MDRDTVAGLMADALLERRFRHNDGAHPALAALRELAVNQGTDAGRRMVADDPHEVGSPPLSPIDPVELLQHDGALPSLPTVYVELRQRLADPDCSVREAAEVITRDAGLTAWLLRVVNSASYGLSGRVDTVTQAVAVVGMRQLETMVASGMLQSLMWSVPRGLVDMERLWRHSLAVGGAAREIWRLMGRPDPERLFVAGVLHDVGYLAFVMMAPQKAAQLVPRLRASHLPGHLAERELLGFDHAKLGGMLLHKWNMPVPLVMSVLRHHEPESVPSMPEPSVIHLADIVARAMGYGPDAESAVPPLSASAWEASGLTPQHLEAVANAMTAMVDDLGTAVMCTTV